MTPAPTPHDDQGGDVASLRVSRAVGVDVATAVTVIGDPRWLGDVVLDAAGQAGSVTVLTDLVLPLPPDGRLLSFRKAAYVEIGPVTLEGDVAHAPISWRSASLAPLFPVFAGRLRIRADGLMVEGRYAPPGGAVGMAADRVLLNVAARGTARWLLGRLAEATSGSGGGVAGT